MNSPEMNIDKLVEIVEDPRTTKRNFFAAILRIKTLKSM